MQDINAANGSDTTLAAISPSQLSMIEEPLEDPLAKVHNIAIVYTDAKREYYPTEDAYLADIEVEERVREMDDILRRMGFITKRYLGDDKLFPYLAIDRPDLVLNMVDSIRGNEVLASAIPAALEVAQIPYTGSSVSAFILTTSKYLVKETLKQYDIPTPDYELITDPNDKIPKRLKYPLFTKLNNYNGSIGITNDSVSENEEHLRARLKFLIDTYHQPVILEEFIDGKELSCLVIEDGNGSEVFLGEKVFKPKPELRKYNYVSYDANWIEHDSFQYGKWEDKTGRLTTLAKKCLDIFELSDYTKIDIRIDEKSGRAYFTDINANPALGPVETATASVAKLHGISFENIIKKILRSAITTSGKY